LKIYSRSKCWKKGGAKAVIDETKGLLACIGTRTICSHVVECFQGMRKSEAEGGAEMSAEEIHAWAEEQRLALKEVMKQMLKHDRDFRRKKHI